MEYANFQSYSRELLIIDNNSAPANNSHACLICLIDQPIHTLEQCQHKFCHACLVSYLDSKISEAQVVDLSCPKCPLNLSESFLQSVVSEKNFEAFKNLKTARTCEQQNSSNFDNCFMGRSWFDINWSYALIMIFMPLIFPFLTLFVFILIVLDDKGSRDGFNRLCQTFSNRFIVYLILFCLSPIIEILGAIGGLIFIVVYVTYVISRKFCLFILVGVVFGIVAAGLCFVAGVLIIILAPIAGLIFLALKLYFTSKRYHRECN